MSTANDQHAHRVAGGYKATLHNPNASEEAKQHAREFLEGQDNTTTTTTTRDDYETEERDTTELTSNQIRGYKSTMSNPNASEEAKEKARHILEGDSGDVEDYATTTRTTAQGETGVEHSHRVLGGYKATLHNPNTSEEAKEHARQALREAGQDVE